MKQTANQQEKQERERRERDNLVNAQAENKHCYQERERKNKK